MVKQLVPYHAQITQISQIREAKGKVTKPKIAFHLRPAA